MPTRSINSEQHPHRTTELEGDDQGQDLMIHYENDIDDFKRENWLLLATSPIRNINAIINYHLKLNI